MTSMSSKHPCDDEIAIYALGALEGVERQQLEEHLRRCPRCRAELHKANCVVGLLPGASGPVCPSPETKRKLLKRIEADLAACGGESARGKSARNSVGWLATLLNTLSTLARLPRRNKRGSQ